MESTSTSITNFSNHLFWDVDSKSIDLDLHKKFIVQRVLEYGMENDWQSLLAIYGIDTIKNIAMTIPSLDDISSNFIATITRTPIESFQCFIQNQSIPHYSGY